MIDGLRKLADHIHFGDGTLPDNLRMVDLAHMLSDAAAAIETAREDADNARTDLVEETERLEGEISDLASQVDALTVERDERSDAASLLLKRTYALLCELAQVADVRQHMASVGEAYLIDHIREAIK